MAKMKSIEVQNVAVSVSSEREGDYISLTDMAKAKEGDARAADIIKNWIRNRGTLEFLGTWEQIYNPGFKVVEFDHFKSQAGLPSFVLSPGQWVETTRAIGIRVKAGRYGGTFAHRDIAFEFGSAINAAFKIYLIREFQRLKEQEEGERDWSVKRLLSKVNYRLQTEAVRRHLVPRFGLSKKDEWLPYAEEADLINVALFGCTAREWRLANADQPANKNIRDTASISELAVLANLESLNAEMIRQGIGKQERFERMEETARYQLAVLEGINSLKSLD
jgi:hypothetical protein